MSSRYEIFVKVIETGSFTIAAKELEYSQSAVSQSVKALENELECTLITRDRTGVTLSKDGETFYPRIKALALAYEQLDAKKKQVHGFVDTTIRIGTFTSVSRNILPPLMASFQKLHPEVKFELRQGEYNNISNWIVDGDVDFGFLGRRTNEELIMEPIYEDTMKVVLPANHPLANENQISLKDLTKDPFIVLDEGEYSNSLHAFEAEGLQARQKYKIYDDYTILSMIRKGMGISILFSLVIEGFEDEVAIIPLKNPISRTISLAYSNYDIMPYAAKMFYQYIKTNLSSVITDQEGVIKSGIQTKQSYK